MRPSFHFRDLWRSLRSQVFYAGAHCRPRAPLGCMKQDDEPAGIAIEAVALALKSLWTRGGGLVLGSPHVTGRDAIGACKVMIASAGQKESVRR